MRSLPKIKLKKGYFVIRVNGKDYHLGKDQQKAELLANRIIADALVNNKPAVTDFVKKFTVEEVALMYANEHMNFYCKQEQEYLSVVIRELAQMFPMFSAEEFSSAEFEDYQLKLANRQLARTTIKHKLSYVRSIFKWAAKKKYCSLSVWQSISTVDNLR